MNVKLKIWSFTYLKTFKIFQVAKLNTQDSLLGKSKSLVFFPFQYFFVFWYGYNMSKSHMPQTNRNLPKTLGAKNEHYIISEGTHFAL